MTFSWSELLNHFFLHFRSETATKKAQHMIQTKTRRAAGVPEQTALGGGGMRAESSQSSLWIGAKPPPAWLLHSCLVSRRRRPHAGQIPSAKNFRPSSKALPSKAQTKPGPHVSAGGELKLALSGLSLARHVHDPIRLSSHFNA